ncbi:MAG: zf-HC2 domain-containing protein [Bryobacterales bacterium]|nr:zf-HC2 domain-containing protein [Bryobacterales bacterium]
MSDDRTMNCEETAERLPWLLNGTLGEEERAAVLRHVRECAGCRRELQETGELLRAVEEHPSPERLVSYVYGTDQEGEREALEEHLAGCEQCRVEVELVRESRSAMPESGGSGQRWRWVGGLAAGLAMAVGVGWLVTAWQQERRQVAEWEQRTRELEREVRRLREPVAGTRLVDLLPRGVRQRSGTEERREAMGISGAEGAMLVLNSQIPLGEAGCRVALRGADGQAVWSREGVGRGGNGELLLRIPGGFLRAGVYEARVNCGGSEESYEFSVR